MIKLVPHEQGWNLSDYEVIPHQSEAVRTLRVEASMLAPALRDRTVWMVDSTARGGGVAKMLPRMSALLEELGVWNSLRQGFGLTVTEAMWKTVCGVPLPVRAGTRSARGAVAPRTS